ncbi:hypothetical protein F4604DRAFT_1673454 [Suillus subluteus]|nr:hypothetical protein F4604DRAFT_1673454 [Suillus subluteus]
MTWKPKAENGQPTDMKSATPVFRPLGNGTESTTTTSKLKTSLPPGIHETEKNKILKLQQASPAAMVPASPLFDSDDTGYHHASHCLTSNGRRILKEITKENSETGRVMEFHGVEAREYNTLQNVLEEKGRVKPRLTYDYIEHVLLVDMPSAIHEVPFTKLKDSFASTLKLFPYNHKIICLDVNMNLALKIQGKSVTPDISITMMKAKGLLNKLLVLLIGECTCSDTVANALRRMRRTIKAHPKVAMAILAVVREVKVYECPQEGSVASETLSTSETPMLLDQFITEEFSLGEPVQITGHDWCHLRSVEYMMLFPEISMDTVMNMIQRGLEKVKDIFVNFTQCLDETIDVTRLKEAPVIFSIDWDDTVSLMNGAVHSTSYAQYLNWHVDVQAKTEPQQIKAGKHIWDSSYSPSLSESSSSDDADLQEMSTISSCGHPKHKKCPTSQPPPCKSRLTSRKRHS